MNLSSKIGKVLVTAALACLSLTVVACGGGSSSTATSSGALSGNWQVNAVQNYPLPQVQLSISGFVVQSNNTLTGNVEVPSTDSTFQFHCGGVAPLAGTVNGQNVTFSLNEGGTVANFTGTIGSDGTSMTGSYEASGGACFAGTSTTGTWTSTLVPTLNGAFTGQLMNSTYMTLLAGSGDVVNVAGSFTQSPNAGGSNASLTGTMTVTGTVTASGTASTVGYPCFSSVTMTGTISGENVFMNVYGYNGEQIGTIGVPPGGAGAPSSPALVGVSSTGLTLSGTGGGGLGLGVASANGQTGPCPPLTGAGTNFPIVDDNADVSLTIN